VASKSITASGLEGRYAVALFELALAKKTIGPVGQDLESIAKMVQESADFADFIKNPVLDEKTLQKAVAALAKKGKFHKLTQNFLGVLVENHRLAYIEKIATSFARILAWYKGEITAEVTSAEKLTKAQETALKKKLKTSLGQDITFDVEVDEELLGGLKIRIGSRVIDSSLKTKLDNLTLQMKGV